MEDKSYQEMRKGEEAQKILESDVFKESFAAVKDHLIMTMCNSPLGDETTHHRLVVALQVLAQIEKSLTGVLQTGRLAKIKVKN